MVTPLIASFLFLIQNGGALGQSTTSLPISTRFNFSNLNGTTPLPFDGESPNNCSTDSWCNSHSPVDVAFDNETKLVGQDVNGCCSVAYDDGSQQNVCLWCPSCNAPNLDLIVKNRTVTSAKCEDGGMERVGSCRTAEFCRSQGLLTVLMPGETEKLAWEHVQSTGCCHLTFFNGIKSQVCFDGCNCDLVKLKKAGVLVSEAKWVGDPCQNGGGAVSSSGAKNLPKVGGAVGLIQSLALLLTTWGF